MFSGACFIARGPFFPPVCTPAIWQCPFPAHAHCLYTRSASSIELSVIPSLRTEKNLLFSNFSLRALCSTSAINYVNVLADLFVLNTGPVSSPLISSNKHIQIKSLRGRPVLAMAWQDGNKFSTLLRVTVLMVITISSGFAPWGTSCHFHEGSLGVSLAEMVRVEEFSPEVVGAIKKNSLGFPSTSLHVYDTGHRT